MSRIRRKQIALFLSLLLTAFMLCQGVAQAAVGGTAVPASPHVSMAMNCHDDPVKDGDKPPSGCPGDCQHLDKASDSSSHLLTALDHAAPVIIFRLPDVAANVGAIQPASLSPAPSDPDPPVTLRLHRFRE